MSEKGPYAAEDALREELRAVLSGAHYLRSGLSVGLDLTYLQRDQINAAIDALIPWVNERGKREAQGGLSAEQGAAIRETCLWTESHSGMMPESLASGLRRLFPSAFAAPAAAPERAPEEAPYDIHDDIYLPGEFDKPAPVPPEPRSAAFIQRADDPPSPPATLTVGGTAPPERTAGDPYPTWLEWAKAHPAVPLEPVLGDERASERTLPTAAEALRDTDPFLLEAFYAVFLYAENRIGGLALAARLRRLFGFDAGMGAVPSADPGNQ